MIFRLEFFWGVESHSHTLPYKSMHKKCDRAFEVQPMLLLFEGGVQNIAFYGSYMFLSLLPLATLKHPCLVYPIDCFTIPIYLFVYIISNLSVFFFFYIYRIYSIYSSLYFSLSSIEWRG